ncbi:FAD-dependent thymidylate synthase [Bacillus inaquosorum]|uniref:FAD-dependent thymidylate synthase n=1 Tax=Bacillus inaquosorum TaxID=483913 RepID=UPI00389A8474
MEETQRKVRLIAHTQLTQEFFDEAGDGFHDDDLNQLASDGQVVALTAVRTCYSANKPTEIVAKEGVKYFGSKASDGGAGTDADRLFRHIFASKHTSTLEHLTFTFAIEGVSRALLAQLTRHRVGFSFSVQSQRYVRMGSDDKIGGFDYVVPDKVKQDHIALAVFERSMELAQEMYDSLRKDGGITAEDARAVLPNATATNLVMTANLTALLSFYSKRKKGRGAQAEITELAEALRREVIDVEPWTDQFFEEV